MTIDLPEVRLLAGRSRRLRQGHPWVFSNEIAMTPEVRALPPGGLVRLVDAGDERLGTATFNAHSLIAARLLDRDPAAVIDAAWIATRLAHARDLRTVLFDAAPHYRLVHGEADGLPGLVIDRLDGVVVVQANTAGMDALLPVVLEALDRVIAPHTVVLANDSPVRGLEGLDQGVHLHKGTLDGPVPVEENGVRYLADPLAGQKTGWFFDQRPNRAFVADLARGRSVLDVYSYAGAFGLLALARGAERAVLLDRSESGLALAHKAAGEQGLADRLEICTAEAFGEMERRARAGERFGLVVCDPPAFAKTRKDLGPAAKGYRKVARLAAPLVEPGGFLFLASCSHHMPTDRFLEECGKGLAQAGRGGRILAQGAAGPDHPLHPRLPESAYLKTVTYQLD